MHSVLVLSIASNADNEANVKTENANMRKAIICLHVNFFSPLLAEFNSQILLP